MIIPDVVTAIDDWAFDSCHSLTNVDSIVSMDEGAFSVAVTFKKS